MMMCSFDDATAGTAEAAVTAGTAHTAPAARVRRETYFFVMFSTWSLSCNSNVLGGVAPRCVPRQTMFTAALR